MSGQVSALLRSYEGAYPYTHCRDVTRSLKPTEPVYLFSPSSLRQRALSFQQSFPGIVSYALKANPENRVVDTLVEQGIRHFDVASIGEVAAVAARHPEATLHFNNPVKPYEAIEQSYRQYGVRSFALDEEAEFDKIRRATGNASDILYSVRFKLGHGGASYDFGSKFGCSPYKAAALLRLVAASGARAALTFHPGSQCTDPQMYARYLRAAARIAALSGVDLEQVNVGGGFPEYYENTLAPQLQHYFSVIEQARDTYFNNKPQLMCEPGRGMVASSVSLLARVIHVRDHGRSLFLNDGVYGGLQEQSLVDLHLPVKAWREGQLLLGPSVDCHVFGPTCDPVDRISRQMAVPAHMKTGDYLEIGLLGAYGSATCTAFNGFRPALYVDVANGF